MKNKILKSLFVINLISVFICGCMADSQSYIPIIILGCNAIYLFLFTLANTKE